MTLHDITEQARAYGVAHAALAEEVTALNDELLAVKRRHLAKLKRLTATAAMRKATLHTAIESAPELFEKPRTQVVDGIKFGLTKQRGTIEFADADAVVDRIKAIFGRSAGLYIRTKETPDKEAIKALTVADAKRIGCTVTEDGDKVVIAPIAGEVEKIVAALLKDATDDNIIAATEAA